MKPGIRLSGVMHKTRLSKCEYNIRHYSTVQSRQIIFIIMFNTWAGFEKYIFLGFLKTTEPEFGGTILTCKFSCTLRKKRSISSTNTGS